MINRNMDSSVNQQRIYLARGYKTVFMLKSAEHEIFSAYKYENANYCRHFHIYNRESVVLSYV